MDIVENGDNKSVVTEQDNRTFWQKICCKKKASDRPANDTKYQQAINTESDQTVKNDQTLNINNKSAIQADDPLKENNNDKNDKKSSSTDVPWYKKPWKIGLVVGSAVIVIAVPLILWKVGVFDSKNQSPIVQNQDQGVTPYSHEFCTRIHGLIPGDNGGTPTENSLYGTLTKCEDNSGCCQEEIHLMLLKEAQFEKKAIDYFNEIYQSNDDNRRKILSAAAQIGISKKRFEEMNITSYEMKLLSLSFEGIDFSTETGGITVINDDSNAEKNGTRRILLGDNSDAYCERSFCTFIYNQKELYNDCRYENFSLQGLCPQNDKEHYLLRVKSANNGIHIVIKGERIVFYPTPNITYGNFQVTKIEKDDESISIGLNSNIGEFAIYHNIPEQIVKIAEESYFIGRPKSDFSMLAVASEEIVQNPENCRIYSNEDLNNIGNIEKFYMRIFYVKTNITSTISQNNQQLEITTLMNKMSINGKNYTVLGSLYPHNLYGINVVYNNTIISQIKSQFDISDGNENVLLLSNNTVLDIAQFKQLDSTMHCAKYTQNRDFLVIGASENTMPYNISMILNFDETNAGKFSIYFSRNDIPSNITQDTEPIDVSLI